MKNTCWSAESECFDYMPDGLDSTIGNNWNAESAGVFSYFVNSCALLSQKYFYLTDVRTTWVPLQNKILLFLNNIVYFNLLFETLMTKIKGTVVATCPDVIWNNRDTWERPTAITSCVMQIDPLPIPTRKPSTPASIKFFAWAAVTTVNVQRNNIYTKQIKITITIHRRIQTWDLKPNSNSQTLLNFNRWDIVIVTVATDDL